MVFRFGNFLARLFFSALTATLLLALPAVASADFIYSANMQNKIFKIDLAAHTEASLGTLAQGTYAMAVHPTTGIIYYVGINDFHIHSFNPFTSVDTDQNIVMPFNIGHYPRAAFSSDGALYLGGGDQKIYRVDVNAHSFSLLGTMIGLNNGGGDFAFTPDGNLTSLNMASPL